MAPHYNAHDDIKVFGDFFNPTIDTNLLWIDLLSLFKSFVTCMMYPTLNIYLIFIILYLYNLVFNINVDPNFKYDLYIINLLVYIYDLLL